jgi:hypothetical protein
MWRTAYWRAAICITAVVGGALPLSDLGLVGAGTAEAKGYYTKKRVNGRWIIGYFPKRSATGQNAVKERVPEAERPSIAFAAAASTVSPLPVSRSHADPLIATRDHSTGLTTASSATSRELAPLPALPAANGPLVPPPEEARLTGLRQALQARANALTGENAAAQGPRMVAEPESVSLDFKSGMKTTLFSDGTTVREPFDVTALKGLAAVPPEAPGLK